MEKEAKTIISKNGIKYTFIKNSLRIMGSKELDKDNEHLESLFFGLHKKEEKECKK